VAAAVVALAILVLIFALRSIDAAGVPLFFFDAIVFVLAENLFLVLLSVAAVDVRVALAAAAAAAVTVTVGLEPFDPTGGFAAAAAVGVVVVVVEHSDPALGLGFGVLRPFFLFAFTDLFLRIGGAILFN